MRVCCAANALKGCLDAVAASQALAAGATAAGAKAVLCPIADGGDGLLCALAEVIPGEWRQNQVRGPADQPVMAAWWWCPQRRLAVIELARASGLALRHGDLSNPGLQHSYGTGQLISAALDAGAEEILVGIGGSSCTDGGSGLARALGWRFLDPQGQPLPLGGAPLIDLASIDGSARDQRLDQVRLRVLCDVDHQLHGAHGAAWGFAGQKGADFATIEQLDRALAHLDVCCQQHLGYTGADIAGAGAAGGCGFGLQAFANGMLVPGADGVLDAVGFDRAIEGCDLVLTCEGQFDISSFHGKAPMAVARRARAQGVPCVILTGQADSQVLSAAAAEGGVVWSLVNRFMTVAAAIAEAESLLATSAGQLVHLLSAVKNPMLRSGPLNQ